MIKEFRMLPTAAMSGKLLTPRSVSRHFRPYLAVVLCPGVLKDPLLCIHVKFGRCISETCLLQLHFCRASDFCSYIHFMISSGLGFEPLTSTTVIANLGWSEHWLRGKHAAV